METLVCPMGGGATRLYGGGSPLSLPATNPDPHQHPNLDPDLCRAPHNGSPTCPPDRAELLRRCEDALGGRAPRLHRKLLHLREGDGAPSGSIRVMQWNILAQALGEGLDGFVRCPPEALSWSRRKYLILEELLTQRPHVVCLQEVDHYHDTLQPVLDGLGYGGHFCPKPWSPCLEVEGNNGPDGCALFYDRTRFELLDSANVRLSAMRIPTNQVAVVTTLRCRSSGRSVCVAVTHLKARSGWEWLRSAQGSDLLRHLQNQVPKPPADSDVPLVVCGDFNAVPSEEVYRRFSTSPLGLDSAYKTLSSDGSREPDYTTWKIRPTGECRTTLDYIWYSRDSLRVDAVLELPGEEQIGPDRLPSFSYPSDHLSLVCDLSFKDRRGRGRTPTRSTSQTPQVHAALKNCPQRRSST